jgi:hypothetical protein
MWDSTPGIYDKIKKNDLRAKLIRVFVKLKLIANKHGRWIA